MLRFDSVARSVASDFLFWDMDGNPIEENTSFINRGSSSNRLWEFDAFHPITAGGKWKYELGVHMTDTGVFLDIFNSFPLQFGQTYDVQYRYPFSKNKQNRRSNRLRWTVPAKREIYPKVRIRALLHPPEHYDRWQTNKRLPQIGDTGYVARVDRHPGAPTVYLVELPSDSEGEKNLFVELSAEEIETVPPST
jgi:hypothetical protein